LHPHQLIIQLTDLHLLRDFAGCLKGVPTWETFREVLGQVRDQAGKFDLMVLSGDLAHDELAETYALLREELGELVPRCRIAPGNHDNRAGLRDMFPEIVPCGEFLSFQETLGPWQVIGLDTHQPGEVSGRIGQDQLDWLSGQLKQSKDHPTLLFMHHPPISVNSPWLDKIALETPKPLCELIQANPQVRAIATGHVHHVFQGKLSHADVFTTPSTGIQFEPQGEESSYTLDPPGYRIFDLGETGYQTEVRRLPVLRYVPHKE
jgi:Icc protein